MKARAGPSRKFCGTRGLRKNSARAVLEMITRKVVLILGAGASMPFGFPSGLELKSKIVERLHPHRSDVVKQHLTDAGFETGHVEGFRSALEKSGKLSVDAFLEHRPEFIEVGKAAIASFLLPSEHEPTLWFGGGMSWYAYFFNRLNARFEEFSQNRVSVLTFNYDRSLEHYLLTALQNSYGKSPDECAAALRSVPIVHLYGQLGQLASLSTDGYGIEYGAPLNVVSLKRAAKGIQIIHEAVSGSEPFERAHELLRQAERACFLGFGYDETNLQRLMAFDPNGLRLEISGSAKGLTGRECQLIYEKITSLGFRSVQVPNNGVNDALEFLRQTCPFD